MSSTFNTQSRRQFLARMSALLASGAVCSMLPQLKLISSATAQMSGDYRAIVCIDLAGGNDSHNMLIPYVQEEYNLYAATRGGVYNPGSNSSGLAIGRDQLLQITDSQGKTWGLNPGCTSLQTLFNEDALSFVSGVGTLFEPTTKAAIQNRSVQLPDSLGSHNTQQQQWRAGNPGMMQDRGWGGLTGEGVNSLNMAFPLLSPNISLAGNSQFTTGTMPGYSLGQDRIDNFKGFNPNGGTAERLRAQALEELLQREYESPFSNAYAATGRSYNALSAQLDAAFSSVPALTTQFPNSSLGRELARVVEMIQASRNGLGIKRQVFYTRTGGWDTHGRQMDGRHENLLRNVADCMLAFRDALREIDAENQVVTFTQSEFGRTLTSNGSGSDHAWAGVQLIMGAPQSQGGSLVPKRIFGKHALIDLNGEDVYRNRGHVIPTVSTQAYGATFSRWMGVGQSDIASIFPGLERFDMQDVGFLG